jgi:2-iminobutanoate/2-iminopropanoate deaminase
MDPSTGAVVPGGVAAQVKATLANVERVLKAAGGSLADVVRVDAYLADIGNFDEYDRAYRNVFGERLPSRTTVGGQLGGIEVEINAIAYLGRES